jgi:hypothetical protein
MSAEELQQRYDYLLKIVTRFMKYRHEYEEYRISASKNNMLRYKREIDKVISDEAKRESSNQKELF